jgi:hypothetical protein
MPCNHLLGIHDAFAVARARKSKPIERSEVFKNSHGRLQTTKIGSVSLAGGFASTCILYGSWHQLRSFTSYVHGDWE